MWRQKPIDAMEWLGKWLLDQGGAGKGGKVLPGQISIGLGLMKSPPSELAGTTGTRSSIRYPHKPFHAIRIDRRVHLCRHQ